MKLLGIGSASSRLGSESGDEEGASDGTLAGRFVDVDNSSSNGLSLPLSLNQVKDSNTNARHAQKPRYLRPRLGLEVMI